MFTWFKLNCLAIVSFVANESVRREFNALRDSIARLEREVESRDNRIMLTEQIVKQQQYMIHRDIELRHLEYLDAGIKVRMAGGQLQGTGIKEDSNGNNESGVNYRAGR
jgi:hypothetical protein